MKVCGSQEYMPALEEELNKIMLFQKELPLSLQLVTQAIDACRRQMAAERTGSSGSESVNTSSEGGHLLEEFIPIKRDSNHFRQEQGDREADKSDDRSPHHGDKKSDWLRSVQLWSQEAEASPDEVVDSSEKRSSFSTKKRAASVRFCKEKTVPSDKIAAEMDDHGGASSPSRSTARDDDLEGQRQKKARRSWSPELHRRFLYALQQLGGSHAATPKHIKQLMKVDGLTNDEIKSHLQKYRLHTRRPASPSFPIGNSQPTQLVVVSRIWAVPEITTAAASGVRTPEGAVSAIYTPGVTTSTAEPSITLATPMRPWLPKTKK